MMRLIAAAVACLGLALLALAPGAASAKVSHCKISAAANLSKLTTRNMRCSVALSAIRRGPISTRTGNLKTKGFSCKVLHAFYAGLGTGHEVTGASVRCTAGARTFTFSWFT